MCQCAVVTLALLLFFNAVPTPARNLTLDNNNTHIFITWAAPANPNGNVNYTVEVQERSLLNNAPATTIESIVTTDLELIVELELESYSEYTVNVTSQTSAGMGMAVSDSFETPEGGKKCSTSSITITQACM